MTEPERWTDAEWAAEQVALARRQAEVARAEARELAAQLAEARAALEAARAAVLADRRKRMTAGYWAAPDWAALNGGAAVHTPSPGVDPLRAIGADGPWTPPVLTPEQVRAHLDEGKAARAEVDKRFAKMERPPEGPDQRLVDGIVDAASAARRGAPRVVAEGRDPATRTRALPVVPTVCEGCEHEAGSYCHHPLQLCCEPVKPRKPPPVWCKVRAELAKAGGA